MGKADQNVKRTSHVHITEQGLRNASTFCLCRYGWTQNVITGVVTDIVVIVIIIIKIIKTMFFVELFHYSQGLE